jgi:hypothetical protein
MQLDSSVYRFLSSIHDHQTPLSLSGYFAFTLPLRASRLRVRSVSLLYEYSLLLFPSSATGDSAAAGVFAPLSSSQAPAPYSYARSLFSGTPQPPSPSALPLPVLAYRLTGLLRGCPSPTTE